MNRSTAGVLISVECKVWAKNILHDRQRRLGSVIFELMMDWSNAVEESEEKNKTEKHPQS